MKKLRRNRVLRAAVASSVATLVMGAGMAFASHPDIPLYTYKEAAQQFGMPVMPVALDGDMKGFPYSPKETCGNCHNGGLTRSDSPMLDMFFYGGDGTAQYPITDAAGTPITTPLVSFADMDTNTFHANMDANALINTADASSQAGKPWTQSLGMAGKW